MRQQFFICPRCQSGLERIDFEQLTCPRDGLEFRNIDGIWRFLLPESEAHYVRFIKDYETVRRFEARGSADAAYYRSLPYKDLSRRFSADWSIRARSYNALIKHVITSLQERLQRPLKLFDLGAGNGWLSNRLSFEGNRVFAVDLLVNEQDGLGAWKNYEHAFTPIQAEFNHLPIMDDFADAVIFNASFHYSEDYTRTLMEALRVLSPQGFIVVMDTPVYRRSVSGEKMVAERKAEFLKRYGFASDSLQSENYLTYARMRDLGKSLGVRWRHIRPFYNVSWMLRPLFAFIRRRREPAQFGLWVGQNKI
jgi:SAM-dependent methyltransferase